MYKWHNCASIHARKKFDYYSFSIKNKHLTTVDLLHKFTKNKIVEKVTKIFMLKKVWRKTSVKVSHLFYEKVKIIIGNKTSGSKHMAIYQCHLTFIKINNR